MAEMQMEAMVVTPMAVTFAKGPSKSKEVFSLFFHSRENIFSVHMTSGRR